ncbi:hypothetical protein [Phascolarctobacterium sp.]
MEALKKALFYGIAFPIAFGCRMVTVIKRMMNLKLTEIFQAAEMVASTGEEYGYVAVIEDELMLVAEKDLKLFSGRKKPLAVYVVIIADEEEAKNLSVVRGYRCQKAFLAEIFGCEIIDYIVADKNGDVKTSMTMYNAIEK